MAENNKNVLKTVGVWAGIATIVAGIVVSAQFLYSLYQNRVILNVSFQLGKLVYYCGDRQSEKNCLNKEAYKFFKFITAEAVYIFSKDNEFVKAEINREGMDSYKKNFENSISNFKIRIPLIIIISNNGNRDTTITKASVSVLGYKGKIFTINTDYLLKKVKANSTEKIELAGFTFGGDISIPGDVFVNSFYGITTEFGKNIFEGKILDKYDHEFINSAKNFFAKSINDGIIEKDIIIKLEIEDQFGNRKTQELNLNSLPMNLY